MPFVIAETSDPIECPCPECGGKRLKKEVLAVTVGEMDIDCYTRLPINDALRFMEELELTGRGGWRAKLDSDAVVELGGGQAQELVQRTQRFVRTLTQVAAQYGRRVDALESADLRHAGGYALRMRGVTTTSANATGPATAVRRR